MLYRGHTKHQPSARRSGAKVRSPEIGIVGPSAHLTALLTYLGARGALERPKDAIPDRGTDPKSHARSRADGFGALRRGRWHEALEFVYHNACIESAGDTLGAAPTHGTIRRRRRAAPGG